MVREPFESWEEEQAFESKVEPARKWIAGVASSMSYPTSKVTVTRISPIHLQLAVDDRVRETEYGGSFDKRLIEGIANEDTPIREEAYRLIRTILRQSSP